MSERGVAIVVMCKEPLPGRVKTRLCPPLSPAQAATLAAAAIADTLRAVGRARVSHRFVAVDGSLEAPGFDVIEQRGHALDQRLAAAVGDVARLSGQAVLLIGMDTPQVTAGALDDACDQLLAPGVDAVHGLAEDGGWWALGLRVPDERLLLGVPTSRADTGRRQRARLDAAGLTVVELPVLRDVDTAHDAGIVAALAPTTAFAGVLRSLDLDEDVA